MDTFLNFLRSNAYNNLDVTTHNVDLQGWMDPEFETVFKNHAIKYDRPIVILEIGSWKGLSTSTMARVCKENNINAKIIAIDTWLGAPEFWTTGLFDNTRGGSFNSVNGYPMVYFTFIKNIKKLGYDDIIIPLPLSSTCAVDVINYYKIKPDIIYIDAAHEYESVKQDIDMYRKLLNDNGMIFGDDYSKWWPGVIKAVDDCFENKTINGVVWSHVNT